MLENGEWKMTPLSSAPRLRRSLSPSARPCLLAVRSAGSARRRASVGRLQVRRAVSARRICPTRLHRAAQGQARHPLLLPPAGRSRLPLHHSALYSPGWHRPRHQGAVPVLRAQTDKDYHRALTVIPLLFSAGQDGREDRASASGRSSTAHNKDAPAPLGDPCPSSTGIRSQSAKGAGAAAPALGRAARLNRRIEAVVALAGYYRAPRTTPGACCSRWCSITRPRTRAPRSAPAGRFHRTGHAHRRRLPAVLALRRPRCAAPITRCSSRSSTTESTRKAAARADLAVGGWERDDDIKLRQRSCARAAGLSPQRRGATWTWCRRCSSAGRGA